MPTLTMPRINISFQEAAASYVARSDRGTVLLLLRDAAALAGKTYSLMSAGEIPAALTEANQGYVARTFRGYATPPRRVLLYVYDGETKALTDALAWAATQQFDYVCGPADVSAAEASSIAEWVADQREDNFAIYKAVLPDCAADDYAVVNFAGAGMTDGTSTWTTAAFCSRIAGLLAGTPVRISATYAALPELTDVTRMTMEAMDAAVGAGKLILWYDGAVVRTGRAVNSLTTTSATQGDSFKKIKLVAAMDQTQRDLRSIILTEYIGVYPNSYDNKLVLLTAVRGYFQALEAQDVVKSGWVVDLDLDAQRQWLEDHGVDTGEMTVRELREADTGSEVFLTANVTYLDAIEDVTLKITI